MAGDFVAGGQADELQAGGQRLAARGLLPEPGADVPQPALRLLAQPG
jgi:hypothetical protein